MLIRHGQAQAYLDNVIAGQKGCTGLSDLGRRQARALRDRVKATGELSDATHVYASTLPRAIETAEIVAEALGIADVEQDCDLCEVHPGEVLDGMSWDEYREKHRPEMERFDAYAPWGPGVETWAEFTLRTGRRLRRFVTDHPGGTIVVACHGGVIRASMQAFGNLPLEHAMGLSPENTSITEWEHVVDDVVRPWWLVRYNDAGHLADL